MHTQSLLAMTCGAFLFLAACEASTPSTASDTASATAPVADQTRAFAMPNARISARPGNDSVLVEVRSLPNVPPNTAQLRAAARQYCGGDASVGFPVLTNRMRFNTIRQYLVRCS